MIAPSTRTVLRNLAGLLCIPYLELVPNICLQDVDDLLAAQALQHELHLQWG